MSKFFEKFRKFRSSDSPAGSGTAGRRRWLVIFTRIIAAPLLLIPGRLWAQFQQQQREMVAPKSGPAPTTLKPQVGSGMNLAAPFRVKVINLDVSGGSKPGDTVTFKLKVEHTGGSGTVAVPWYIHRDNSVPVQNGSQQVTAGSTAVFEVTTTWTATAGPHSFYGGVDPQNSFREPPNEVNNNVSARSAVKVYSDWARWAEAAKEGTKNAGAHWVNSAGLVGVTVNAVIATGGRIQGPPIEGQIADALGQAGAPSNVRSDFARAVQEIWKSWCDSVRVPALPWYPAFAAWPGPMAPPQPNVPTPAGSLAHDATKILPPAIASAIKAKVGDARNWPGADAAIDGYALWFTTKVTAWMATSQVTLVMGKGSVPTYAPPYVPVGPVVAGDTLPGRHFTVAPFQ